MSWINRLEYLDQQVIVLLNGNNIMFLDNIMWFISKPIFGLPFYIFFIFLFFKNYSFKNALLILIVIGLTVGLGDFTAHELIKESVQRYRPSHNLEITNQLNFVYNYKGGQFGFVSNHATNMSIVGIMVFLVLKKYYPKSWIYLLTLVLMISYSRIYLGVHYLSDIIGGWVLGSIFSLIAYNTINKLILKE
jgi:undecaprenyl-diphosphatase